MRNLELGKVAGRAGATAEAVTGTPPYSPLVELERMVGRLAARQQGLITIEQLHSLGLTNQRVHSLCRRGVLLRVRRSIYQVMGCAPSWEATVLAAVLAAGPGALASHGTAGALWGFKYCDRNDPAATIHVTAPRQLRVPGVTGHIRTLGTRQRRVRFSVPLTGPEQTLLDVAGDLGVVRAGECLDELLRRGLADLNRLRRLVEGAGGSGRRALGPARLVLSDRLPGYDPGANPLYATLC